MNAIRAPARVRLPVLSSGLFIVVGAKDSGHQPWRDSG